MKRRKYNIIDEMGCEIEGGDTSIVNVKEIVNKKIKNIVDDFELERQSISEK